MDKQEQLLTSGSVQRRIIEFAIPLFLGNLFQQLYNAADSLIVGRYLGSNALAAVSTSGNLIFLIVGFFSGIASGAGVIIGRYLGARDAKGVEVAVHTTVVIGMIGSILMTFIGTIFAKPVLQLMGTPEEVLGDSVTYFQIYFLASVGFVMYNIFVGILQAAGDSRHPLYYLMISSIINVVLDLAFIRGMHKGVGAAALATGISQLVSAFLCMVQLLRVKADYRLVLGKIRLNLSMARRIIDQGLPAGIQNSVMSFSNVVIQSYINAYGAMAMAGIGAYVKIEGFLFIPVTSFALALTTFVSQNMGARQEERIKRGVRFGVGIILVSAQVLGILMLIFAKPLLGLFDHTPQVIQFGYDRCKFVVMFFFLCAFTHAMGAVLRGIGKPAVPMIVFLVCWCIVRIIFLSVTEIFVHSIVTTYLVYPITWTLSSVTLFIYYKRLNIEKILQG